MIPIGKHEAHSSSEIYNQKETANVQFVQLLPIPKQVRDNPQKPMFRFKLPNGTLPLG